MILNIYLFLYNLIINNNNTYNTKEAYDVFLNKVIPFKERLENGEVIEKLGQDLLEFRDTAISKIFIKYIITLMLLIINFQHFSHK